MRGGGGVKIQFWTG